jgi:hypothetical protein
VRGAVGRHLTGGEGGGSGTAWELIRYQWTSASYFQLLAMGAELRALAKMRLCGTALRSRRIVLGPLESDLRRCFFGGAGRAVSPYCQVMRTVRLLPTCRQVPPSPLHVHPAPSLVAQWWEPPTASAAPLAPSGLVLCGDTTADHPTWWSVCQRAGADQVPVGGDPWRLWREWRVEGRGVQHQVENEVSDNAK